MPPRAGSATNSGSPVLGATGGMRLRPHCSHAAITTFCQCVSRRSRRSRARRTIERAVATGWIDATPSSVAFCRTRSIRSPAQIPCARWISNGDSRSIARRSRTAATTPRLPSATSVALDSAPSPLKSTTSSPRCSRSAAT